MKKLIMVLSLMIVCNLAFGAAATMYVQADAAGGGTGLSWAQAWNLAEFESDVETACEAGDKYFVEEGTYSLTNNFAGTRDGTTVAPIYVIGVVDGTSAEPPTSADWATGDNRPFFTDGGSAYDFYVGDNHIQRNLRVSSSDGSGFRIYASSVAINCKATNTGAGTALRLSGNDAKAINCEATGGAAGIGMVSSTCSVIGSYAHDTTTGLTIGNDGIVLNNIIDTCTTGMSASANFNATIINNTIYGCTTGISGTTARAMIFMNNIIDTCTNGAVWTTAEPINDWDYNNWSNITVDDTSLVTKGGNATAYDPDFADAAGGNFTLNGGSQCRGAGFSVSLGVD